MEIIIVNKNLKKIITEIKKDKKENLFFVADFDRTLTYGHYNNIQVPSIMSLLRINNVLNKEYSFKSKKLFEKYHQIEADEKYPLNLKKIKMEKWWEKHTQLLVKYKLSKNHLIKTIDSEKLNFRKGFDKFINKLYENKIPLIVFSASNCGEVIILFFKKQKKLKNNIFFILNKFIWKNNIVKSIKKPIIHSMNKNEIKINKNSKMYKEIKDKKNIILLGDSTSDVKMLNNLNYKNVIKIGFLNPKYNKSTREYKKHYDIILKGDKDMNFVNQLIKKII